MCDKTETDPQLRARAAAIRLIATDLDGTLLRQASELSPRTARAVKMVRSFGISFTVCTGRSFYELGTLPQRLALDIPVICRNGAEIVDPASQNTLFRRLIPAGESEAFIRYCLREEIDFCLTTQDEALFPQRSFFADFFGPTGRGDGHRPKLVLIDDRTSLDGLAHYKIILLKQQPKYDLARAFAAGLPGIRIIGAAEDVDDLIARGANKGDGLRWVAEYLGLDRSECCAFGDYANDIPLLQYAGLSFAMENAGEDVRAAADHVAPSNTADGVARVLEALFGQ